MLDQMRKQSQSTLILLLFGFIVFVFVFSFGAGSVGFRRGGCGTPNVAAVVNGEAVPATDYALLYRQRAEMFRRGGLMGLGDKSQIAKMVMDDLVERELLVQSARALGLRVSDAERNDDIRKKFVDEKTQKFDYEMYKRVVQYYAMTPRAYEENYKRQMLADRMRDLIRQTASVTDDELEFAYRSRETKIDLEVAKLSPAMFEDKVELQDADIDTFLKEHKDRVEANYAENEATYHQPAQRQLAHVLFQVEESYSEESVNDKRERAELTYADLEKGQPFDLQVKEYSEDQKTREQGGDLGLMSRQVAVARYGEAFAEAAFALEEGKHSKVVRSSKGFHVLHCSKVIPAVDRPLAAVERDITRSLLKGERAKAMAQAEAERLLKGLAEGRNLENLVKESPKALPESAARKTGLVARMNGLLPQLGMDRDLTRAAFALSKEKPVPEKVWTEGDNFIVFRLIDRADPDMAKLAEQKDALREELLMGRQYSQVESWTKHQREVSSIEINQQVLASNPFRISTNTPTPDDY